MGIDRSLSRVLVPPLLGAALMTTLLTTTALVLGAAPAPGTDLRSTTVLVTGRVDLGPTCPVQRPGEDCTDHGVPATVTAQRGGSTRTARADASGFRMRLPRGVWRITADAGMSCESIRLDLRSADRRRGVVIDCDTGIR